MEGIGMAEKLRPLHYDIEITPDLDRFQFQGRVRVILEADHTVKRVELNILELAVWRCRLRKDDAWQACSFCIDPDTETLAVDLPESRQGSFQIQIEYAGRINDRMAGFYRSGYEHAGRKKFIAVTQFQESSARQAFPCMDHPRFKATFDIVMTVPEALHVIANTSVADEKPVADGMKSVRFERSPVMSTYLVFFAVGEFEFFADDVDPRVRVAALPGLGHTTGLGLSFGRKALAFCEAFYGIDYPLSKMDLIAVPDFAFGAMENWGAITFRENLLLHFPETTSAEGVERICEVIAHEIAHQWFGNLVTPADWKYLWLNESFATYFGYGVVAHTHPDWGTWDQFLHAQTATAMDRDGLTATFPIEIPGGEHVVINSSTAPIIYNKGASMLRMIQGHIGPERYRQGVRTYLHRHTYACAESRQLWEAFEDAAAMPITAMVQSWIGQPGYPLLTARQRGGRLVLEQKRFTYLAHEWDQRWMIPVTLSYWTDGGGSHDTVFIMDGQSLAVDLPAETAGYKLNAGQTGFYRVQYTDDNLDALGRRIQDGTLDYVDRWGVQNDLYALVRSGQVSLSRYLDFLGHYTNEDRYLPLVSIFGHLGHSHLVAGRKSRTAVLATGREMVERVLTRIGMTPDPSEPHTIGLLRGQLLWQAAQWGYEPAIDFSLDLFDRMLAGKRIHPDIARSVMQAGALRRKADALDWFIDRFAQTASEHERMNILAAMAAFDEWDLIEAALEFALESVPPRNQFMPVAAAGSNPAASDHIWNWYKAQRTRLEAFHPLLYERVITGILPIGGLEHAADVKTFFEGYLIERPQYKDAAELALENLAINGQMRAAGWQG
jgi:aminopeptidase N